ncbi:cupin domain-containing protein [Streptomyces sp. NPDC012888]|uniref:cupin domain-containing protein n=1 Tax=Streptomyces sp. NPDC012888 TaxID=3364855 RepID=UPI0036931756
MNVVSESEQRTTRTPSGAMFGLAAPSTGSTEVSTWRVEIGAGSSTPAHIIDREQIWMPLTGAFDVTVDGEAGQVKAGEALVVPAGVVRQLTAVGDTQALVAMAVGGKASMPGNEDNKIPLPWAE